MLSRRQFQESADVIRDRNKEQGHPRGHCFFHTPVSIDCCTFHALSVKTVGFLTQSPGRSRCYVNNSKSRFSHDLFGIRLKEKAKVKGSDTEVFAY
jgi:hypothetical protein